jgi:hypothetical protein
MTRILFEIQPKTASSSLPGNWRSTMVEAEEGENASTRRRKKQRVTTF